MRRKRLVAPAAAVALLTCAGCFTMTNVKSAKVSSPGVTLNVGGVALEDQLVPMVEARLGLVPKWDLGYKIEPLCQVIDTRIQFLEGQRHGVDLAVEGGVGLGFVIRPFGYAGVSVSKDLGTWNPYCLFRFVDMTGIERDDVGGDQGPEDIVDALFFYVPDTLSAFWEIFLGVEIELSGTVALVPEFMVAPTLDEGGKPLALFNLGLLFRFGRTGGAPPAGSMY